MKSLKKWILSLVIAASLVTSCGNSAELSKLTDIIVSLSEPEKCDLRSSTVRENEDSYLDLIIDCEIEDSFRYGKFLLRLYEMLEKENISYPRYSVSNNKEEKQMSLESKMFITILNKKELFESTLELLKDNNIDALVNKFNTNMIGVTDWILTEALYNKYNLKGEIIFGGFQMGEHEFELAKEILTLITFSGRDEYNSEITITLNLAENDNMLYGIEF